jgi:lipoate-protein ligase A
VNGDLNTLRDALLPAEQNLPTKAPRSRRAPVVNLATVAPTLTTPRLAESLYKEFQKHFPQHSARPEHFWSEKDLAPLVEKHHSHEWVFGQTPQY